MARVIDVRGSGGDLVVLGKALVLPTSHEDGSDLPLDGSIRFNPVSVGVEMSLGGVWQQIGSGGSSGSGSGPFPIAAITGLETVLANKAPKVHVHAMSEVTGLLPALDTKAAARHTHSISDVATLQPQLDIIATTLDNKAALYHNHSIADITGLSLALDARAPVQHTHPIEQVLGLKPILESFKRESIGVSLPGRPPADWTFAWTASRSITFADDFSGSFGSVQLPPSGSDYILDISKGGQPIGSITIRQDGGVRFSTVGTTVSMVAGESLVFRCPSTQNSAMQTVSFTLVARVD